MCFYSEVQGSKDARERLFCTIIKARDLTITGKRGNSSSDKLSWVQLRQFPKFRVVGNHLSERKQTLQLHEIILLHSKKKKTKHSEETRWQLSLLSPHQEPIQVLLIHGFWCPKYSTNTRSCSCCWQHILNLHEWPFKVKKRSGLSIEKVGTWKQLKLSQWWPEN